MSQRTIDLRGLDDEFVIHYGGRLNQVNAYTFANSLIALADSIRATNTVLNPGQDVEIAVEALGQGSFRARIRTTKQSLNNLFSLQGAGTGLIVGLLGNHIWQAAHPNEPPNIIVNDDSIVLSTEMLGSSFQRGLFGIRANAQTAKRLSVVSHRLSRSSTRMSRLPNLASPAISRTRI